MTTSGDRRVGADAPLQALLVGIGVLVAVTLVELLRGAALGEALPQALGFAVPFAIVWAALSVWRARRR